MWQSEKEREREREKENIISVRIRILVWYYHWENIMIFMCKCNLYLTANMNCSFIANGLRVKQLCCPKKLFSFPYLYLLRNALYYADRRISRGSIPRGRQHFVSEKSKVQDQKTSSVQYLYFKRNRVHNYNKNYNNYIQPLY